MSEWLKCPVCYGRGLVPNGFYLCVEQLNYCSTAPETCRACDGKGVMLIPVSQLPEVCGYSWMECECHTKS